MIWNTPIDWEHGLFLQPQHFQYTELNQHYIHSQFLRYITPFFGDFPSWKSMTRHLKAAFSI